MNNEFYTLEELKLIIEEVKKLCELHCGKEYSFLNYFNEDAFVEFLKRNFTNPNTEKLEVPVIRPVDISVTLDGVYFKKHSDKIPQEEEASLIEKNEMVIFHYKESFSTQITEFLTVHGNAAKAIPFLNKSIIYHGTRYLILRAIEDHTAKVMSLSGKIHLDRRMDIIKGFLYLKNGINNEFLNEGIRVDAFTYMTDIRY